MALTFLSKPGGGNSSRHLSPVLSRSQQSASKSTTESCDLWAKVRRRQVIRVGVTYEQEVDCGSGGLRYSWTLLDSAGGVFPLPAIHTHGQTLTLPAYLLGYGTYTAVARVGEGCPPPPISASPLWTFPELRWSCCRCR